ncbi:MAG TPA: hypothetical protein VGI09_11850 [Pseudolabrys sp.]
MPELLYEEGSFGVFLLVTIILGGGAALLAGRAIALTWRPAWQVIGYSLVLAGAVRFIHFSLFGGSFLSFHYFLVDAMFCMGFAYFGFRAARRSQMVRQYRWLTEPDGPMRWRRKMP